VLSWYSEFRIVEGRIPNFVPKNKQSFPEFILLLFSSRTSFLLVSAVPKYLHFETSSNYLLYAVTLRFSWWFSFPVMFTYLHLLTDQVVYCHVGTIDSLFLMEFTFSRNKLKPTAKNRFRPSNSRASDSLEFSFCIF